jgi:Diguanylate cyclase, GGDEF domain
LETTEQFTGVELHDEQVGRGSVVASFPSGFRADGPLVRTEPFTFGGRRFVLRYAPRLGNSILGERTIPGPLMLGTGVALSILLGSLLWLLAQVGVLYQRDRHGHQAGDRLLKAAAGAWEGRLRKTDLLARYGGKEFVVVLPNCGLDNAMEIAERLRTAQTEVTCSIGVATWAPARRRPSWWHGRTGPCPRPRKTAATEPAPTGSLVQDRRHPHRHADP